MRRALAAAVLAAALAAAPGLGNDARAQGDPLSLIKLPPGFSISLYALVDDDRDGNPEGVGVLFEHLRTANGIAWKDGWFYIAEQHRLSRYRAPDLQTLARAKPDVLFDGLPDNPWHGWRYARFDPDSRLYVALGAPCNICAVDGLKGTVVRVDVSRPGPPEVYTTGVRNSVGLDFHPVSGDLFFTDNGGDNMGDDSPQDELNPATGPSLWFGFPWYGGGHDRSPQFKDRAVPRPATFPTVEFGAHVAALGISFYTGDRFPADYKHDAFFAQHGSWNRSVADGYRVMRIRFDKTTHKAVGKEVFASGWLGADGEAWGRPVDVKQLRDGSLPVSDDRAGAIYRITYTAP